MPVLTVRQSRDRELIEELHREIFPKDDMPSWNGNVFWVATCENHYAGYCSARRIDPWTVFFSMAGVLPGYRGRGIHRRMVDVRLRWARSWRCEYAITYALPGNWSSVASLIRQGFEVYEPKYAWVGDNVVYLRLPLLPEAA